MIGRSHGSIMQGTSIRSRSASVASAHTQRLCTEFLDQNTTTTLASQMACSMPKSKDWPAQSPTFYQTDSLSASKAPANTRARSPLAEL
jgi:hypothetical protein